MNRHWTINGRFLTQAITGVQRYANEILRALDGLVVRGHPLARDLSLEVVVPASASDLPRLDAISVRRFGGLNGHLWEQARLPFAVRGGLISLCNSGPVAVRKQVVCVHDVNTRILPQSYSRKFRALHRVLIPTLGVVAERIATVSHHSADQIRRFGIARPDKIIVIGNGHEHALEWRAAHSPATRAVAGRNTIVVIGTVTPNKNVRLLIGMADQLAQANLQLAVVGATNLRVFGANLTMSQARNVHFLGRISEREIAALLQDSLCLAFPSFVEGFGLPPVEAMALGCPTVVSNTSCLPEICGDAALYASPADANEWHERFVQLRDNPALRRSLVDRGYQRTKTYRWSRSAELYLEAMAQSDRVTAPSAAFSNQHPETVGSLDAV